ncbi:TetR family transcriptional regulator [Aurantimonas coralicida]|nr:TetR family transcriptional regulator [Aurantimonas coralicida]|tara:strand:+ start:111 stop:809 length:699 start_codon:yes stop_codon:yes gene_type:complete
MYRSKGGPDLRRTKQDAMQTREAILDAAETLFYEQGVAGTTLSHIAASAGLTRGAIYWHFSNKLELFRAMQERAKLPQEEFFDEQACAGRRSLQDLYENTLEALRHLERDERTRKILTILLFRCEYVGEMQDAMLRRADAEATMHKAITGIFAAVQIRGELKHEWQPKEAATAYVCAVSGVISEWLRSDRGFDLTGVGARVVRSVIAGFACSSARVACLEEMAEARAAANLN